MFVFKKMCIYFLVNFIKILLGWLVIIPLAFLFPKKKNKVVIIGCENGIFLDNTKYLYLNSTKYSELDLCFVSEHKQQVDLLRKNNIKVKFYPSLSAIICLLQAKVLIVDTGDWSKGFKGYFLHFSKKVQMWHGVGFKKIQILKWMDEVDSKKKFSNNIIFLLRISFKKMNYSLVKYDIFFSPSFFYQEYVFKKAFISKEFLLNGYPRNAFKLNLENVMINVDVKIYENLVNFKKKGLKIIVYTPTFRDSRESNSVIENFMNEDFQKWCYLNEIIFLIKPHPSEKGEILKKNFENIYVYNPKCDIYPILPLSSALVTDYSSIYMDYLHLNKPILFYVPDLKEYIKYDRKIQFNYDDMTPGLKFTNIDDFKKNLIIELESDTQYLKREKMLKQAFDNIDQSKSSENIINSLIKRKWLN